MVLSGLLSKPVEEILVREAVVALLAQIRQGTTDLLGHFLGQATGAHGALTARCTWPCPQHQRHRLPTSRRAGTC